MTPNLRKGWGKEKQQFCKSSEVGKSPLCERNWKEAKLPEAQ